MKQNDRSPGELPPQQDQSKKKPPIRIATIIMTLLTAAAGMLVWQLYPSLPDPVILEGDKAEIPLILVVGLAFIVQVIVVVSHHFISKSDEMPALLKDHLVYLDVFFLLFILFWLGLHLHSLSEYTGFYIRGMYLKSATIASFSGFFSYLGSRPWVAEAIERTDKHPKIQAQWIKAIRQSSKVLAILAGFACLGFIFPEWPIAHFLGVILLLFAAVVPFQTISK